MQKLKYLLLILIGLCYQNLNAQNLTELNWTGTLNNKIPINLKYSISDGIIIGQITYLNTKRKIPIKLIGTIDEDKSFRILEFENNGNISGIITGKPSEKEFVGSWFSPKSRKSLSLQLTNLTKKPINNLPNVIIGSASYHYGYSEKGSQGDFEIKNLKNRYEFSITSVTDDPARNIADVEGTVTSITKNSFKYKLPGEQEAEFQVTFYSDFIIIKYTKGDFEGQFGHNASIEGIYLKQKK